MVSRCVALYACTIIINVSLICCLFTIVSPCIVQKYEKEQKLHLVSTPCTALTISANTCLLLAYGRILTET